MNALDKAMAESKAREEMARRDGILGRDLYPGWLEDWEPRFRRMVEVAVVRLRRFAESSDAEAKRAAGVIAELERIAGEGGGE